MERRSKSLQQMFNDAHKIQHNIQGCEQIRDEELEKRTDNSICPLEIFKANDSVENYIPRVERGSGDLASNPYHDKQRDDCFMYSFVDNQEDEFTNQFVVK